MELIINHMYIQIFSFLGALDIPRQSQSDKRLQLRLRL